MRLLRPLGALALLVSGCTTVSQPGGLCAPSSIEVSPTSSSPGEPVVVTGKNFFRGCSDVGGSRSTDEMVADSDIRIEFHQDSQSWPLVTVDANPDYTFETVVEIPSAASRGPAMVAAVGDDETVEVAFNVE